MNPFFQHRFRHLVARNSLPAPPVSPAPAASPLALRLLRGALGIALLLFAGLAVLLPAVLAVCMIVRSVTAGTPGPGQRLSLALAGVLMLLLYHGLLRRRDPPR